MKQYTLPIQKTNKVTIVDKDIYKKYKSTKLSLNGYGYVLIDNRIFLHREILGISYKSPMIIDHISGDILDNRRENLRLAFHTQNAANMRKQSRECSSEYKGVSKWTSSKTGYESYQVGICLNYKNYHLGSYKNEKKAALVYDKAALFFFGDFARLNFPDEVHKHKKLNVRYVDYDSDLVEFLSEKELKSRAEKFYEERKINKQRRLERRLRNNKKLIQVIKHKKYGEILKIPFSGINDDMFLYASKEDYEILSEYRFYIFNDVVTGININDPVMRRSIFSILNLQFLECIFKDKNKYNFVRENLDGKIITNLSLRSTQAVLKNKDKTTSKYLGVRTTKEGNFRVGISNDKCETISLGTFTNEVFAAKVYDVAAKRKFGSDAILNFPDYNNENIKLPNDKDYIPLPQMHHNHPNRVTKYFGVSKDKNRWVAKLGKFHFGSYESERLAALVIMYASMKSGLYKADNRWLNFEKSKCKSLSKEVPTEIRSKVTSVLGGHKWA